MFEVEIKNLSIKANIGITSKERKKKQLLKVTLSFYYPLKNSINLNDIENVYNSKIELPFEVDINEESGELVYEAQNSSQQNLYKIINESGTILPKAGFVLEF